MRYAAGWYAIGMGIAMLGMWTVFYITDSIPELQTRPIELGMHLTAEAVTAFALLVGGTGVSSRKW